MVIDVLTLFPNMYDNFLTESIIKRAIDNGKVKVNIHNIRDYTVYNNNQVDDYPFGGGGGMVLMCDPIFRAIDALKDDDAFIIMMTPGGIVYKEKVAYDLSQKKHLIILCGHYEGFDERIKTIVDMEISIGDFVLTGGELPALCLIDAVSRKIEGTLGKIESADDDSFSNGLIEYPHYTKPREYRGLMVPEVLLNGNHKEIKEFRFQQSLERTKNKRPDLYEKFMKKNS